MKRLIDANKLMAYCQNQKSRTVDCNDIARFPIVLRFPKNPTNGDVIKALFPDAESWFDMEDNVIRIDFGSETLECLNLNWWNDWWKAPYKKGAEQ